MAQPPRLGKAGNGLPQHRSVLGEMTERGALAHSSDDPEQRPSCLIQRITYGGQFSMAIFRDFAEQRNIIASRSTNVTFSRSIAIFSLAETSSASRRSTSGRYSFVNCPQS